MTTYLELCNRILSTVSEPTVSAVNGSTNPTVIKLKDSVRMALEVVQNAYCWSWLNFSQALTTWSGNSVTVDNLKEMYSVHYRPGGAYCTVQVRPLSLEHFYRRTTNTSYSLNNNYPTIWTQSDQDTVLVDPYPTTEEEQEKVIFNYCQLLEVPTSDSTEFTMPERFIQLIELYATHLMCARHVHDTKEAMVYKNIYDSILIQLVSTERSSPRAATNFYNGY